jgi:hypothetical protein
VTAGISLTKSRLCYAGVQQSVHDLSGLGEARRNARKWVLESTLTHVATVEWYDPLVGWRQELWQGRRDRVYAKKEVVVRGNA